MYFPALVISPNPSCTQRLLQLPPVDGSVTFTVKVAGVVPLTAEIVAGVILTVGLASTL